MKQIIILGVLAVVMAAAMALSPPVIEPPPMPIVPHACQLPIETGPGRAAFQRFGFDSEKGRCVEFTFGGMRGNANNFETREECREICENFN